MGWFWTKRAQSGRRENDPANAEDMLALRKLVDPFLATYTDGSPIVPWVKERLNPYKPDTIPCHRLELDHIEGEANWRDAEADVAAIPYAPPLSFWQNPPEKLYDEPRGSNRNLFFEPGDDALEKAVYDSIYERGIDHLWSIGELDESYRLALLKCNSEHPDDRAGYQSKLMVTWAIDSAIPGVDVQRVVKHEGSIEAICGDSTEKLEIPSIQRLNELTHEARAELNRIYEGLAEMADNAGEHPFATYEDRSVALFMRTRSIVDTCRWYMEQNTQLPAAQREILHKTLVDAYTTYHAVLQTCGSRQVDDMRADAFRDVSTLLCGSKVDTGVGSDDIAHVNLTGEEDYIGAFMAAASYDGISHDYGNKMLNGLTRRIDSHGGARSYFGTFEHNPDSTIRQQLTLMCILYYRMPQWQQDTYKDLISSELSKKLECAMGISTMKTEQATLYIPTQDLPIEVSSNYQGAFDWNKISEIHAASQMTPLLNLIANHKSVMQEQEPRLQIRPGGRQVTGLPGEVNEAGVFVPYGRTNSENTEAEAIPPLFESFIKGLAAISESEMSVEEKNWKRREIIEKFLAERTGEVSTELFPWLEARLNPPPIDMLPCLTTALPDGYIPNSWEKTADHALIPHIPPIEYLLTPPNNLWQRPGNEVGKEWSDIIDIDVENVVYDELVRVYSSTPELQSLIGDRAKMLQLYWTWAMDTRIDGVDILKSYTSQHMLQRCVEEGRVRGVDSMRFQNESPTLTLILPQDLLAETVNCKQELDHLHAEISNLVALGQGMGNIEDYKLRVNNLRQNLTNTISMSRWYLEKGTALSIDDGADWIRYETVTQAMQNAYSSYNTLLQTCNRFYDKGLLSADFHDISQLIGGYKVDQTADGRYGQEATPSYQHDYFDAFMAISKSRSVAAEYARVVGGIDQQFTKIHEGGRALLGTFEAERDSLDQQLVLMGVMYQRMPTWQREVYGKVILGEFAQIKDEIKSGLNADTELPIFIPSRSSADVKYSDFYPYQFSARASFLREGESEDRKLELVKASYTYPWVLISERMADSHFRKPDGRLEIRSQGKEIQGWGSFNYQVDELGFLHPGFEIGTEQKQPVSKSEVMAIVESMGAQREKMWLSNLAETPSVTVESRLGPELAKKIEALLDQSKSNGSTHSLGSLSVVLEQLLGRKMEEGDLQYLEMLKSLGMLNREVVDVANMGEDEIMHMLQFVKTEKPKMEDMDESSLILLFLGAAGVAPRQELVEQIIKAHETTSKVLTLEAVLAVESIAVKKKLNILQMLGLKPKEAETKSFLSRRDELRIYLAEKCLNDRRYEPEADEVWGEMQMGMWRYITDLLHSAKRYDSTADATLFSVLTAKDKGELLARCSTNAELLTLMINVGIPEFGAHLTRDYGPEGNLPLQDWFRRLLTAKDSGGESHAYTSHNRPSIHPNSGVGVVLADGEAGSVRALLPDQVQWLDASEMTYGTLANHNYGTEYTGRSRVIQYCVHGGSFLTGSLAADMRQFDLAEMANPDDIALNRMVISGQMFGSHVYPKERRAKSLRRVMSLSPYDLAMSFTNDYTRHTMIERMQSTIELGREVGNWGAAFLAANIMKNAGFLGTAANQQGAVFISQLARRVAIFPEGQYSAILKQHSEFLTASDLEVIAHEREEYLAELAELKRQSSESARRTEKTLKRSKMVEIKADFESSAKKTTEIYNEVHEEELQRKRKDIEEYGVPEGEKNKKIHQKVVDDKVEEIENQTVDPDTGKFDDARFELLTPAAQDALLLVAVTDRSGKLLEGFELTTRLSAIQEMLVKYAHDHTQLRAGSMGANLMMSGGVSSALVVGFEQMAQLFNSRLETAVSRTGLPVSLDEFNPRHIAERMGRRDSQSLLGRGQENLLASKLQ